MSYYIASCSCGRDSMAMTLRLIEEGTPLNEIVFYSNGMDFDSILANWRKIKKKAEPKGIKCTMLEPRKSFKYSMFEEPHQGKHDGIVRYGYGWCGGFCRWGTHEKVIALDKYCKEKEAFCYVGIALDEEWRARREYQPYKIYPLIEWGMTEEDCLAYCRKKGITWEEEYASTPSGKIDLYDILDRVSCWCCANKNQWELYNIWRYLPLYWDRLTELQEKIPRPFKKGYTLFDLEERFINGYIPKHRKKPRGKVS